MKKLIIQTTSVLTFLVLWKGYVVLAGVSPLVLPAPEAVFMALYKLMQQPDTYFHIKTTLYECLGGFTLAVFFGTVLGQVLGRIQILDTVFKPFIVALQLTPKVALIPLFILWFGFGLESKIVISAVMGFFPVFSNSYLGAKSVDNGLSEVFTVGNALMRKRFRLLVVPASLPYILTGMEMAIVLSIIGAVVSEFVAGSRGLGFLATVKLQEMQVDMLFAVVILLASIGFILYFGVGSLRKMLVPWHESAKSQGVA